MSPACTVRAAVSPLRLSTGCLFALVRQRLPTVYWVSLLLKPSHSVGELGLPVEMDTAAGRAEICTAAFTSTGFVLQLNVRRTVVAARSPDAAVTAAP